MMDFKRIATIAVVVAALAAWLAAAVTPVARVSTPPARKKQQIEQSSAALAVEISRLHDRLRPTAQPRDQGRNLFQFSASRAAAVRPGTRLAAPPAPMIVEPLPPALKLSGIAEDSGPDGPVRTAVISGMGQLFLAKEGDTVASRYRVTRISVDVVELADVTNGSTIRLAMR